MGTPWGFLRDPWGTPKGPLRDPLGIRWGPLGTLGDPWGPFRNPLGIFGYVLGFLGEIFSSFEITWEFFWTLWVPLRHFGGATWSSKGLSKGPRRGPERPLGSILGAFCTRRKHSRSDSLQYTKTFKFTITYCKNRGPVRLKPLKISRKCFKTREKAHKNHKLNNTVSKIDKNGAQ